MRLEAARDPDVGVKRFMTFLPLVEEEKQPNQERCEERLRFIRRSPPSCSDDVEPMMWRAWKILFGLSSRGIVFTKEKRKRMGKETPLLAGQEPF
jgi:hypothetical protein